jgi:hypothetical protein
MRILLSCLQSLRQHAIPAYDFWRPYFLEGCREAGIDCLEVPGVDWAEGLVHPTGPELSSWRTRTWETVLSFARTSHSRQAIDFFLGYLYPSQVAPEAITELQQLGIPCVNFFCDNVREFHRVPSEYGPFALHWVPEFEAIAMYREAGLAHVNAPMPCWVPPSLRTVPERETEPPTFIGSADGLRRNLVGRALQLGGDFIVRGPGWGSSASRLPQERSLLQTVVNQTDTIRRHGVAAIIRKVERRFRPLNAPPIPPEKVHSSPSQEDYQRITREAMVAIGVNRVSTARASDHRPLLYSRLRDIEAPMLGACYLTEWTQGLEKLYDLGSEIESYRTAEELTAKLTLLHGDLRRRKRLREAGQKRALADHSVARSLARIGERIGLKM